MCKGRPGLCLLDPHIDHIPPCENREISQLLTTMHPLLSSAEASLHGPGFLMCAMELCCQGMKLLKPGRRHRISMWMASPHAVLQVWRQDFLCVRVSACVHTPICTVKRTLLSDTPPTIFSMGGPGLNLLAKYSWSEHKTLFPFVWLSASFSKSLK